MSSRPSAPIVCMQPALTTGQPTGAARLNAADGALGSSLTTPNRYPVMPRRARLRACRGGQGTQCRTMMHYNELVPAQASALVPHADRLRLAVAGYLARFKGTSTTPTPICAAISP